MNALPEFLCLKYATLPTVPELLAQPKVMSDFGWSCRRAIKWMAVHVDSETDRDLLKRAGDSLIDEGTIPLHLLGRVYEIRLKASAWNKATGSLDRQPRIRGEWSKVEQSISIANGFAGFIADEIHQRYPEWNNTEYSFHLLQLLWVMIQVAELFGLEPHALPGGIELVDNEDVCVTNIHKWWNTQYVSHGATFQASLTCSSICTTITDDLGFASIDLHDELPTASLSVPHITELDFGKQPFSSFIQIEEANAFRLVRLNSEHAFFDLAESPSPGSPIHSLVLALANTLSGLNFEDDKKRDFISLLNLEVTKAVTRPRLQ